MANRFQGRGNLAGTPALKEVTVNGETRQVCAMRVYFDRLVPDSEGGFMDKGGFWLEVNLWGTRGEAAGALLSKGARVYVEGTLVQDGWKDRETGEDKTAYQLIADYLALDLSRVERVVLREGSVHKGSPVASAEHGDRQHAG